MTKAVRSRILKDANGDIGDHLRNHIHLTNCIHLKNHMHKQSPNLSDRSLVRDLIALQRSRSLRDPSASPPSWNSPSVVDELLKKSDKDAKVQEGRRKSVGGERQREGSRRRSGGSPSLGSLAPAKVVPDDFLGVDNVRPATSDRSSKSVPKDVRRVRKEESFGKSNLIGILEGGENRLRDVDSVHVKTLSEQLNDIYEDSDKASASNRFRERNPQPERTTGEARVSIRGSANRRKRRKFRSARRTRTTPISRDVGGQNEMSVASNSLGHGSVQRRSNIEAEQEEEEEYGNQNVSRAPKNGCGIPFNWSRIHDRGKTFLDIAGRSLSCGLSDSRSKKQGTGSHDRDVLGMAIPSDHSSSSAKSDGEARPLLVEAYGSQGSTENAAWEHDYSGELGIYVDNLLKNDDDSDLASEGRSGNQRKLRRDFRNRHQNLTQKYMPRTFRDLVGQNLVVQALSNAVTRRKIGLLYVFYGHHGTEKTSCARVFARALNCQSLEHLKPCGYCNACIAHEKGKSRTIKEVGPVSNFDFEDMTDLLDNVNTSHLSSQYKVFIFDDCDSLSLDCWSAISKVIDRAPRRVVFILICSNLEVLPHIIIARCQKFFFPKLKDADVVSTLQRISSRENIDIDKEALKLVASRSDGSLRDAEMTLEQLSLLGQKITVALVQELVGLISDEKLVDLLDLALSADTVNTVKNLRAIMESGVEPLALMSQLATIITDILAGSYDFAKDRNRRKFFRKQPLSKEDMEKLRQALKTLSEAEKQLRTSNDKLTWLTAALLQLAPDQQYLLPGSSVDGSFNHSPLPTNDFEGRDARRVTATQSRLENQTAGVTWEYSDGRMPNGVSADRRRTAGAGMDPQRPVSTSSSIAKMDRRQTPRRIHREYEEIWFEVLLKIQHNSIRDFLYQEGKLVYIGFGAAPTVQLVFSSHVNSLKAEKLRAVILQAFESVLGSPVTIEMRSEASRDSRVGYHTPLVLPTARAGPSAETAPETNAGGGTEIVEIPVSFRELKGDEQAVNTADSRRIQHPRLSSASQQQSIVDSIQERRNPGELSHSKSLVRGKVSLAHVIQQAEAQQAGWSKRKAVSIAEKLEQENLRLESRSRNLLCWKAPKVTRRRISRLKVRTRRPHSLLKLVSCGKCLSSRSPR